MGEQVAAVGEGDGGRVHLSLLDGGTLGFGQPLVPKIDGHCVNAGIGGALAVDHLQRIKRKKSQVKADPSD